MERRQWNGTTSSPPRNQVTLSFYFQVWNLESFKVRELPKLGVEWKPNVCFNFLAVLLARLVHCVDEGHDSVAEVKFKYDNDLNEIERR